MISIKKKPKVFIFGTGAGGVNFFKEHQSKFDVIGFIDNNNDKQGKKIFGRLVYAPEQALSIDFEKIIIASDYYKEIFIQLTQSLKIDEEKIVNFFDIGSVENSLFADVKKRFSLIRDEIICGGYPCISNWLFWLTYRNSNLSLVKHLWLDMLEEYRVHQFAGKREDFAFGPTHLDDYCLKEKITLPDVNLYSFENACVRSSTRSIILSDGRVVIERIKSSTDDMADYAGGNVFFCGNKNSLVRRGYSEALSKGILISGGNEKNYYHWLIEVLTQLQYVEQLPKKYQSYPILISSAYKNMSAVEKFVNAMCGRKLILMGEGKQYQIEQLLVMSQPNNIVVNAKYHRRKWLPRDCFYREESILYLRKSGFKLVEEIEKTVTPKRIFLARKPVLRQYNQKDVFSFLCKYGFEEVYMEDLTIEQQISYIANAEYIVGPTGAAWTNVIFAKKGTKALCWMAKEIGDFPCYSQLAKIVGVELNYIFYDGMTQDSRRLYYQHYTIELSKIALWLEKVKLNKSGNELSE
ncbi:glycosyltransferase family 61 protein [Motilimonas eburnea]|uniref:glycosyltransferase family 61 protein n=1 Tax=Motilimonas eburnea TaxID=1737488 RepID=UPI001E3EDE9A|nr:glycosyltransferase family 61 protein [Motilimonas eburnea]MCE2571537.1 glycosyltransferase 61 family protein [Motilimonas eburnea]